MRTSIPRLNQVFTWWLAFAGGSMVLGQARPAVNYDEDKVPAYTLPDPLTLATGERVESAEAWRTRRRPELLKLFEDQMFGRAPGRAKAMTFKVLDLDRSALAGKAVRKQVTILFRGDPAGPSMDLLLYLPAGHPGPVPVFLVPNFQGNHAVHPDPGIRLSERWIMQSAKYVGVEANRATEKSRGGERARFPLEMILARGYGLATYYYGDLDPDFDDEFKNGVHGALDNFPEGRRPPNAWGAIGAWAWGASRTLDYLETDADIDARRVIIMGHSRLGKTALWAGAQDERFAIVISNNSGCGGAALSKRAFGETVARINTAFPHWFCGNFKKYNDREADLPFDQHELIALIAPRPVYVASAVEDRWADPKGEFLATLGADPVYRLLGTDGLPVKEMPAVDHPVHGTIGYHLRSGGHNVTDYDWQQYLAFADRHLAGGRGSPAASERPLPAPRTTGGMTLREALARRRSVRSFENRPLSPDELSQLCWAAQGITDSATGHRSAPSALAQYPISLFIVDDQGTWEYQPKPHALRRISGATVQKLREALGPGPLDSARLGVILAMNVEHMARRGGQKAERFCLLEAGHIAQNLLLEATALGLAGVPMGGPDEARVSAGLQLPPPLRTAYVIPIGAPRAP